MTRIAPSDTTRACTRRNGPSNGTRETNAANPGPLRPGTAAYRGRVRFRFLVRPGWIALILLVGVFSTLCFTVLAPWQYGRHLETQARNTAIRESLHATPRPLDQVLGRDAVPSTDEEWARVNFSGRYLPRGETLAWQRTVLGEPAFEVLTPFRLEDGRTVLVDRGYIRPVNSTRAPNYAPPPSGEVELTARVRLNEIDSEHRSTFRHDGHRWTYAINAGTVTDGNGIRTMPGYFTLVDGQPGALRALPLPQLDAGPYFSYSMQWIIFGSMAPLALLYLIYTEARSPSSRRGSEAASDQDRYGGRRPKAPRKSVAEAIAEEERREREQTTEQRRP